LENFHARCLKLERADDWQQPGSALGTSVSSTPAWDAPPRGIWQKCWRCCRRGRVMKAKEPRKGGMPRFVPSDDNRAVVKLLAANGYWPKPTNWKMSFGWE